MRDIFCPPNCTYLNPTEADQTLSKEPHRCLKYNRVVQHKGHNPQLVKCVPCSIDKGGELSGGKEACS